MKTDAPTPETQGGRLPIAAGLLLAVGGLIAWVRPSLLAGRFHPADGIAPERWHAAAELVVQQHAALLAGLGLLWVLIHRRTHVDKPALFFRVVVGVACLAYIALCTIFSDWLIDDAAITFAYSENLVLGNGLVLYPGYEPQEAYSNTLWMLMLAGLRAMGVAIPFAAKLLGMVVGAATLVLSAVLTRRLVGASSFGQLAPLLIIVLLQAPYIIWSSSGLEHGLQGLGYLAVVTAATASPVRRAWPTALLAMLIFVRPEVPLIVACVWAVFAHRDVQQAAEGLTVRELLRSASIAVVPAVALAGLLVFRISYFGDPMPTPFYAKAGDATFLRLLNPFGGGWGYVLRWATVTGMLCVFPLLAFVPHRRSFAIRVALAIVAAQLAFVVYAGGDWMGCFRFMAALVPLLAVLLVSSVAALLDAADPRRVRWLTAVASTILVVFSWRALVEFRAAPTTPMSVVADISDEFVSLANRLGVQDPLLAHHDAGGASYLARIRLVDLGGLGDRDIAKNWDDPEFMRTYLFERKRPTFIFGAINFAAKRTRFHEMAEFRQMYIPLRFVDKPIMRSDLCHVRKDLVRPGPGLTVERDAAGAVIALTVASGAGG